MTSRTIVELKDVFKSYGDNKVVKDLNLRVKEGEFLTLLGPSGCGKTTTLRMIAGFEDVTEGTITIEGEDMAGRPPYKRDVNTAFQNYALFPHMTVFENIAFGLHEKKIKKSEIKNRVSQMLDLVQLGGFEKRMPSQMSGGQKQRVSIARALVNRPKVLLLDEPLGALDLKLRKQMQVELKHLQRKLGITFIYVTHDQEEALTMSDRIAVMHGGVLEQVGTPSEIYDHPSTKFVADFIGESNILEANVASCDGEKLNVIFETGKAPVTAAGFSENEMVYLSIRPEKLKGSTEPVDGFGLCGIVKEHIYVGSTIKTIIALQNGQELRISSVPGSDLFPVDATVYLYWDLNDPVVMHTSEEKLLSVFEKLPKKLPEIEVGA